MTDVFWIELERLCDAGCVEAARAWLQGEVLPRRDGVNLLGFGDAGTQCFRMLDRLAGEP